MRACLSIPLAIVCVALLNSHAFAQSEPSGDIIYRWNDVLYQGLRELNAFDFENRPLTSGDTPPRTSRVMAMMHGAVYDAVNGINATHAPFRMQRQEATPASQEAAAMQAAYVVLDGLFGEDGTELVHDNDIGGTINSMRTNQFLELSDRSDISEESLNNGIAWGQQVGEAMLNWRSADGAHTSTDYDDRVEAYGKYHVDLWTPDAESNPAAPGWGEVMPFAIDSADQFTAPGPPDMNSDEWQQDLAEVINLGDRDRYNPDNYGGTLPEDVEHDMRTAFFWAAKGLEANGDKAATGTVTPPGMWNQIADEVAQQQDISLADAARLYATLSVAGADATIASWKIKYDEDFWRPIHAHNWIPDDPDNPEAGGSYPEDSDWIPLIPTSMHPEYLSGHSTAGGTAAAILAMFFGTDEMTFTITGDDALDGEFRTYTSFLEAAQEAGRSRILGGIHYEFTNQDSLVFGDEIGDYVYANFFQPLAVPEPATFSLLAAGGLLLLRRRRPNRAAV